MHYCGNFWHDAFVNAVVILCALPVLRTQLPRLRALLSSKKEKVNGEEV